MTKTDYDIIIIGAGIGSLTTAALLVKHGFKVIVIEKNEYPGGCCSSLSQKGYNFDIGASLFWGFDDGEAFNSLFRKLGVFSELVKNETFRKLDPGLQIVMPDHRINIFSKRKKFFEELKREFPDSLDNLKKLYKEVDGLEDDIHENHIESYPYSFVLQKKDFAKSKIFLAKTPLGKAKESFKDLLSECGLNGEIEKFFDLQTMYFGQNPVSKSSLLFSSIVLGIPKRGVYYVKGGSKAIINILENFIKKQGGDIAYNTTVDEVLMSKKTSSGVSAIYEGFKLDISSRCVVSGVGVLPQTAILKSEKIKKKYKKFIKGVSQKYVPFTVLLGVNDKVVPDPMKEHLFMLRDYDLPREGDNLLFVSVSPKWDKTRAPVGKRAIMVTTFLRKDLFKEKSGEKFKEKMTKNIIKYLEQVIPFISDNIDLTITIDPEEYQKLTGREHGGIGMFEGSGIDIHDFKGSSRIMPFKRMLLVGDSTYPGYGAVSAVKSGLEAASLILGK